MPSMKARTSQGYFRNNDNEFGLTDCQMR